MTIIWKMIPIERRGDEQGPVGMSFGFARPRARVEPVTPDLEFRAQFPLGIRKQEHISVRLVDGGRRVQ